METDTIRRYLLGDLLQEEQDAIEEAYFSRDEGLDTIGAVEEELIESYLAGRLDPTIRARFENHYLASPVHRQRVAFSRALRSRAARNGQRGRRRSLSFLGLAAAAILVAAVGWYWGPLRTRPAIPTAAGGPTAPGPAPGAGARAVTLILPALAVRGESDTPTVRLRSDDDALTLGLERGDAQEVGPFEATLRHVEGVEVWRGPATPAAEGGAGGGLIATVTVPSAALPSGDYLITLSRAVTANIESRGDTEIRVSYFRVQRP